MQSALTVKTPESMSGIIEKQHGIGGRSFNYYI